MTTPLKRAEKLVGTNGLIWDKEVCEGVKLVAAQLEEACAEAFESGCNTQALSIAVEALENFSKMTNECTGNKKGNFRISYMGNVIEKSKAALAAIEKFGEQK